MVQKRPFDAEEILEVSFKHPKHSSPNNLLVPLTESIFSNDDRHTQLPKTSEGGCEQGSCELGGVCKDCTTCFRHSDLVNDRPSTTQFKDKLPLVLDALPSADCAKGGHGAYTNSIDLNGYGHGVIQAFEFRTYHTPLNRQGDYVNAIRAAREFCSRISASLKMDIFPYSVFYIFFEQYLEVWNIVLINIAIALGAVFVVCLVITVSLWSSAIILILLVLVMIILDLMDVMEILGIQLNVVSIVNLIMAIGIAVEFCVHIAHAFMVSSEDRSQRARTSLCTMEASVFSGITLTKLVGVLVLYFSTLEIFVVYYFQMYLASVIIGFLHGLVFLHVVLSLFSPSSSNPQDAVRALDMLNWIYFRTELHSRGNSIYSDRKCRLPL